MKVAETKLTRGNITTVPKAVRMALKLEEESVLEWHVENNRVEVRKKQ